MPQNLDEAREELGTVASGAGIAEWREWPLGPVSTVQRWKGPEFLRGALVRDPKRCNIAASE